jgi:predicted XRE-type DNA-binding protein
MRWGGARITRQDVAKASNSSEKIQPSSGNVFADLGPPNAEELDNKVRLAVAINRELEARKLTQAAAAATLAISQPKVSLLRRYKLKGFSIERLMLLPTALGSDIEIRIRPLASARRAGRILVQAA